MLFKLAFRNVRRQINNYLIYFITVSLTVALMFAVNNVIFSDLMEEFQDRYLGFLQPLLLGVSGSLCVVIAFVLGYATSFLLRRRKKEFGLYLTMGMSRGNILAVFAGETAVTFLLSLGVGIVLGAVLFQSIMAIILNFLEQKFVFASYSSSGILVTVIMVGSVFLIASLFSLIYLGNAKISSLLQGEKKVEKTVKNPVNWFAVVFIALAVIVVSVVILINLLIEDNLFWRLAELLITLLLLAIAIIVLPFGLAKGVIPVLLKRKKFSSRGTNTFTLRQLSGRLTANASMLGVLSFLLAVAVVGANFMMFTKNKEEAYVYEYYPFDIAASYSEWSFLEGRYDFSLEEGLERIQEYAEVEESIIYYVYDTGKLASFVYQNGDVGYKSVGAIRESDYRKLCTMIGSEPVDIKDGYAMCWRSKSSYEDNSTVNFSKFKLTLNGVSYSCVGTTYADFFELNSSVNELLAIIPDEAAIGLKWEHQRLNVTLKNSRYDAYGLTERLSGAYVLREYERLDVLGEAVIYLLIAMFVSIVFVLLSMAVLALKILSMLVEDRERYRAIWRLGADVGTLKKSLFAQIFFFFFLPLVIPLALSAPLCFFFVTGTVHGSALPIGTAVAPVAGIAGVLLLLYAIYFIATYLLAWRDVKKALRCVG